MLSPRQLILVVTHQQSRRTRVAFGVFGAEERQSDSPSVRVIKDDGIIFHFVCARAGGGKGRVANIISECGRSHSTLPYAAIRKSEATNFACPRASLPAHLLTCPFLIVIHIEPALTHHLFNIAIRKLIPTVPTRKNGRSPCKSLALTRGGGVINGAVPDTDLKHGRRGG